MKKLALAACLAAGAALTGWATSSSATSAAPHEDGYHKVARIKHLMGGIVKPSSGAVRDALKAGPSDDEAWGAIAMHGALLGEAGQLLLLGDRVKDDIWKSASEKLSTAGAAILKGAEKKDAEAVGAAAREVGAACGQCHKEHKK